MKKKLFLKFIVYTVIMLCLLLYGYYQVGYFEIKYTTLILLLTPSLFYFNEIYRVKYQQKSTQKMLRLLCKKYKHWKKIDDRTIEIYLNERIIRLNVMSYRGGGGSPHRILAYLNISNYEQEIIDKLRIHFYCTHFDKQDWVGENVGSNLLRIKTIKYLVNETSNTSIDLISKTDKYVAKLSLEKNQ